MKPNLRIKLNLFPKKYLTSSTTRYNAMKKTQIYALISDYYHIFSIFLNTIQLLFDYIVFAFSNIRL